MRLRRAFKQTAGPSASPQDDNCSWEWRLLQKAAGVCFVWSSVDPPRLKPRGFVRLDGTAEAVPLQDKL
jgi:hypothetical protein